MHHLCNEVLGGKTLHLVGQAGEALGRRELAVGEIDALVDGVTRDYEAYRPRLPTIGNRLARRPARPGGDLGGRSPVSSPVRGRGVVTRRRVGSRLPLRGSEYRRLSGQLCIGDMYPMR